MRPSAVTGTATAASETFSESWECPVLRAGSTGGCNTLSFHKKMECEQWFTEHESITQQHRRRTSGIVGNEESP